MTRHNDRTRVSATIIWEDCGRPAQGLYFETTEPYGAGLVPDPHAFLIAGALPAIYFGERRIWVDGAVCPHLLENLEVALSWIVLWCYEKGRKLIPIEVKSFKEAGAQAPPERAGFLFSGGIDSLATLRHNHLNYPSAHPGRIRDGFIIYGLEVRDDISFGHVLKNLKNIALDAGIELIPLYTNIRGMGPEKDRDFWGSFWLSQYMGATFGAAIHALSNRFTLFSINSCHDIPNLMPYSSHPLVNPYYSSSDLRIKHEGINFSRFEKTRIISDWQVGLDNLRVCNDFRTYQRGMLNCGVCEKCVRTMLALVGCGVLERAAAFSDQDVSVERIDASVTIHQNTLPLYQELLEPLARVGRDDLVQAIHRKIDDFEKRRKMEHWRSRTIGPLAAVDEKHFHSFFTRGCRRIFHVFS